MMLSISCEMQLDLQWACEEMCGNGMFLTRAYRYEAKTTLDCDLSGSSDLSSLASDHIVPIPKCPSPGVSRVSESQSLSKVLELLLRSLLGLIRDIGVVDGSLEATSDVAGILPVNGLLVAAGAGSGSAGR